MLQLSLASAELLRAMCADINGMCLDWPRIFAAVIYEHGSLKGLKFSDLMTDSVVLRALRIFRLLRIL